MNRKSCDPSMVLQYFKDPDTFKDAIKTHIQSYS